MTVSRSEIRPGAYYDSIVLMQLQQSLASLPGVLDAGVVMATPANVRLLEERRLVAEGYAEAGPDDLLIVVQAKDGSAATEALGQVDELLKRRHSTVERQFRHRSLETARKALPGAKWVLISVPGRYAAAVARDALEQGLHVFLYSDNVALEDEIDLKRIGLQKGLLLMGPDCGTAIINGVGFGFANRVRRGGVGLIGASGTGLQAISSQIHNLGAGISHAIGTGGRDLKAEVGAITGRQGLDLLRRDENTQVIVLVSKPPAPEVAADLLAAAQATGKPVVVSFIGYPVPGARLGNLHFALDLSEAAELAVELLQSPPLGTPTSVESFTPPQSRRYLRGLFSGGSLAYAALQGLQTMLVPLYSNVPIHEAQRLPDPLRSQAHSILDLGEDVFTVGRLHPMMDNELRLHRLRQEAEDPEVALLLLDVVLGEGAHPDPASELGPAIRELTADGEIQVVAILVGTAEDPQGLSAQIRQLTEAGARVFRTTSEAVEFIGRLLSRPGPALDVAVDLDALEAPLAAINAGLESFFKSLEDQGAAVVHVDWRPPAGGDERLLSILERMKSKGSSGR